ncbi:hypothetical protein E3N88_24554 [Mikania micrantha]|uniref:Uncharacterized protein n=1 Tax=Mikania micrantha TaxID=192012 RepID=A0A5N6N3M0_9ASTR|nr:hypothetical protein E3N88_24554 [Mikania micrantha]
MTVAAKAVTVVEPVTRRSANYEPSLWSFDHIQSLSSEYKGEDYKSRADTLKDAVKMMIPKVGDPALRSLELVDDIQRLGIAYHFEEEIRDLMEIIYCNYFTTHHLHEWNKMNLNLKALGFRLMRQHGYHVPQEIFNNLKDTIQNLKPHSLEDARGVLNLYEASYHSFEDESILDDARDLTTKYLKENIDKIDESISSLVSHALELPLHWRVPRVESMWFIGAYEKRSDMSPTLLELAKLDFDMVQAIHIEDLKHTSRWWRNTSWDTKLSFSRDRVVLNFLWTIGTSYTPHNSPGRRTLAKINSLITIIDDVYDVYGTLDELQQFTEAIDRWDINVIEELPDYMKICFLGFYNTINEISYDILTNTGHYILPYFKKSWADLCKAYLVEARWYYNGYTPTFQEYLDNACVSISGGVILMHAKFSSSVDATKEILQCMQRFEKIDHYSSLILRLLDDLATSTDELARGDNLKSMECYMRDTGATEEEARGYIKELVGDTWKKLNKERNAIASSKYSGEYIEFATNLSRMAQFVYGEGDGHGHPDILNSHVSSLIFNPILSNKQLN